VFHINRWGGSLEFAFRSYSEESGLSEEAAWRYLAMSAVFSVARRVPGNLIASHLYLYMRCEARKEIERALLNGQTLDEYQGRGEQPWPEEPEEDTPEALALEARIAEEMRDSAEKYLDTQRALAAVVAALTPKELEAVLTEGGDDAMRASRYRAMKKLKKLQG